VASRLATHETGSPSCARRRGCWSAGRRNNQRFLVPWRVFRQLPATSGEGCHAACAPARGSWPPRPGRAWPAKTFLRRLAHGTRQVRLPGGLPGVEMDASAEVGAHEGDSRGWGATRTRALALGANTPWGRAP
jgi:hypothetical protein